MVLAHVAGAPVEELASALAGAGGLLLLARGWLALQLGRLGSAERARGSRNLPVTPTPHGGSRAMAEQSDRIEREVLIAAPVERVWELITRAEHLGTWFGDAGAEVDLRPGGALTVTWQGNDSLHGQIEAVEPPRRFAWRWLHVEGDRPAEPTPANSTLVEFTLTAEAGGTRVAVVESGFDGLEIDLAARGVLFAEHGRGWSAELGDLAEHVTSGASGASGAARR